MFLLYYIKQGQIDVPHVVGGGGVLQECYVTKGGINWNVTSCYMGGGGGGVKMAIFPLRTF